MSPSLPSRAEHWALGAALDCWIASFPNLATQATNRSSLILFVAGKEHWPITQLARIHVQVYVTDLQTRDLKPSYRGRPRAGQKLSRYTVVKNLKALKQFFKWLHAMFPHEVEDLGDFIKLPKLPDLLLDDDDLITPEMFHQMLAVADNPLKRLVLLLMWDSGARVGELASMTWSKLDLSKNRARVMGKRGERWIRFGPQTVMAIYDWKYHRHVPDHDYILHGIKSPYRPYTDAKSLSQVVNRLAQKAGIEEPVRGHRFRKTFTNRILDLNVSPQTAALALGDTLGVAMRYYAKTTEEKVMDAVLEASYGSKQGKADDKIIPFRPQRRSGA